MIKITDKEFHQIADYVKANYGIQLKDEKKKRLSQAVSTPC